MEAEKKLSGNTIEVILIIVFAIPAIAFALHLISVFDLRTNGIPTVATVERMHGFIDESYALTVSYYVDGENFTQRFWHHTVHNSSRYRVGTEIIIFRDPADPLRVSGGAWGAPMFILVLFFGLVVIAAKALYNSSKSTYK